MTDTEPEAQEGSGSTVSTPPPGSSKPHSPFWAMFYRKLGEVVELGGKAMAGLSGFGLIGAEHNMKHVDWGGSGLDYSPVARSSSRAYIYSPSRRRSDMPDSYFAVVLMLGVVFGGGGLLTFAISRRIETRHERRAKRRAAPAE